MLPPLDEILANFELLDDWEDRYRYLIELGRMLPPLPEDAHTEANKVRGCASQVWLSIAAPSDGSRRMQLAGDSDAHIVKGLVALLVALYGDRTPEEAVRIDPVGRFRELGLAEHLTPQRSNGLRSMVDRVRAEAGRLAEAA